MSGIQKSIIKTPSGGFTIIELLIVIVVIVILATISIVSYVGIQERATQAAFLSSLESYEQMLRSYKAKHGYYPPVRTVDAAGNQISNIGHPELKSVCLGNPTSDFKATDIFPANVCTIGHPNGPVVASQTINEALKTTNKILPSAPSGFRPIGGNNVTDIHGVSMGDYYVRGLTYFSTRAADGRSLTTAISFFNYGDQPCGHAKPNGTMYADGKAITLCTLTL